MRGPKLNPIEVLPMVAGLIDAGLAHAEEQCATLKAAHLMPYGSAELIGARLVQFAANLAEFHATYENQIAGYSLGPNENRELARLRGVLARTHAAAMEGKQVVEEIKTRWS